MSAFACQRTTTTVSYTTAPKHLRVNLSAVWEGSSVTSELQKTVNSHLSPPLAKTYTKYMYDDDNTKFLNRSRKVDECSVDGPCDVHGCSIGVSWTIHDMFMDRPRNVCEKKK